MIREWISSSNKSVLYASKSFKKGQISRRSHFVITSFIPSALMTGLEQRWLMMSINAHSATQKSQSKKLKKSSRKRKRKEEIK